MEFPSHNKPTSHAHAHNPNHSSSDLFSDAKVVAEAANASLHHGTVDKGKVADAAADLLDAASRYGKLEGGSYGKYVEKAENYLHQYNSSHSTHSTTTAHSTTTTTTTTTSAHSSAPHQTEAGYGEYMKMAQGFLPHSSSSNQAEGGYGQYMKMAEGFLGHSSSSDQTEGGYGEYMKMAEGFLKKH